jgi:hypothetical protein
MRWVLRIGVFLVLLGAGAAIVVGLSRYSPREIAQPPESLRPPAEQAPNVPPPAVGAQWRYTGSPGQAETACTRAKADVAIGPTAKSAVLLCLRRGGELSASIALADTSGRFGCGECQLQARYDEGGARALDGSTSSTNGTAYTVFLHDSPGFVAELKRASTLTLTLPIRGQGEQQATFDVAGLRWNG